MKKIFLITILFWFLFSVFQPVQAITEGFVLCGGEGQPACTLCYFFQMVKKVFDFVVLTLVPILASILIMVGGVMFYLGGTSPNMLKRAKSLLLSVVIGLIIIYGAWVLINTFFMLIGVEDWTGLRQGWWKIKC